MTESVGGITGPQVNLPLVRMGPRRTLSHPQPSSGGPRDDECSPIAARRPLLRCLNAADIGGVTYSLRPERRDRGDPRWLRSAHDETANGVRYDVRTRIGRRVVTRTFKRRKDADAYANTVEADKIRGGVVDPRASRVTLEVWCRSWLTNRSDLRPTTGAFTPTCWTPTCCLL